MNKKSNDQNFNDFLMLDDEHIIAETNKRSDELVTCIQIIGELDSYSRTKFERIQKTLAAQVESYAEDLDVQFAFETGRNLAFSLAELFCMAFATRKANRKRRLLKRMRIASLRKVRGRMPGAPAKQFAQGVQESYVFMMYVAFLFLQDAIDRYAASFGEKFRFHLLQESRMDDQPDDRHDPLEDPPAPS